MVSLTLELKQPPYGFEATDGSGNALRFDNSPAHGGGNYGVSPMQSVLMALAGCSGIDVVSILAKMRQELTGYRMVITGEREKDKVPALWEKVHLHFHLQGTIEEEKAKQAIILSIDKYCSVAETLRRAGCTITWEVSINK